MPRTVRRVEDHELDDDVPIRRTSRKVGWSGTKLTLIITGAVVGTAALVLTVVAAQSRTTQTNDVQLPQARNEGMTWDYPQLIKHLNACGLQITASQDKAPFADGPISNGYQLTSGRHPTRMNARGGHAHGTVYCERFESDEALATTMVACKAHGINQVAWGRFWITADDDAWECTEDIADKLLGCLVYKGTRKVFPR